VGILYKLKNVLPFSVKRVIYFSLVHSHFAYACEIWGHTFDVHINKVVVAQKKAMSAITYTSHSFQIFCSNFIKVVFLFIMIKTIFNSLLLVLMLHLEWFFNVHIDEKQF
jgi:hypothetical protein